MALDAPAPLYPTAFSDNSSATATPYPEDDMGSLVASTSAGFTGPNTEYQPHYHQQPQYQQNPPAHGQSLSPAQAHAQAQAQAAQQQQFVQSLAGVGRRHRTVPAKTFKCTGFGDCAMVFSRSEHLARHVRKHTGERPFSCHCSKQFSRLDNLRQHAQTVHADRPELNARMMARLVEVQGTMATMGKTTSTSSSGSRSGSAPGGSKGHPPRALSLSLSLDTGSSSPHIKSEGGSPDLSLHSQHPNFNPNTSLQQRKARRAGLGLTLSSADIAAANLHAGFHLQGHATAPLPHGHAYHGQHHPAHHGQFSPGLAHEDAQLQHFAPQAPHTFSPSFSLDAAPAPPPQQQQQHPNQHLNQAYRGPRVEYTQSEYGVSAHSHSQAHSDYAGGSPQGEFPFHANASGGAGARSQALPSPPYSAASASGYFPSLPQQMLRGQDDALPLQGHQGQLVEEVYEHHESQQQQQQQQQFVKQEEQPLGSFDLAFAPHQLPQQHAIQQQHASWTEPPQHAAYVSPPITPHLASFPSLSLGGSTAGSLSPHSAFSQSPTIPPPPSVGGYEYEYDEGSLSPEQQGFECGYVHQQQQQQALEFEQFEGKFGPHPHIEHLEHFDAQQQQHQQQEEYYAQQQQEHHHLDQQHLEQLEQQQLFASHQQRQEQQQRQDRWMAQQQYRHEHGFTA